MMSFYIYDWLICVGIERAIDRQIIKYMTRTARNNTLANLVAAAQPRYRRNTTANPFHYKFTLLYEGVLAALK